MKALLHSRAFIFLPIFFGAVFVVVVNGGLAVFTGKEISFIDEYVIFSIQALIVAVPFLVLVTLDDRSVMPWIVTLALTALFWSIYLWSAFEARSAGSGANIGMGILMLFSPVLISIGAVIASKRSRARSVAD